MRPLLEYEVAVWDPYIQNDNSYIILRYWYNEMLSIASKQITDLLHLYLIYNDLLLTADIIAIAPQRVHYGK